MAELAGFDLVLQVTRTAIERELLNTPLERDPNGETIDTLVPPFVVRRDVPLPGAMARLQLIVRTLEVRAVARTAVLGVRLTFSDSSIEGPGWVASMLGGAFDLSVPLVFTAPAGVPPRSQLALDFTAATSTLALDDASRQALADQLGDHFGALAQAALDAAIGGFFRSQGVRQLGFGFVVDPTRDSTAMMTLTAVPQALWLDGETLAVFGHHRQGGSGDPARKTASDLPALPYPGFPNWSPTMVLLSPFSFERLVGCPAVTAAVRDHVAGPVRRQYIDEEKARNGNTGEPTRAEIDAADRRVAEYLARPETIAAIAARTPPPCGQGQLDQQVPMPDPFPATTAYLTHLGMSLGDGRIDILARANAEVFCGSVHVTAPMWMTPTVNVWTQRVELGPVTTGDVQSDVNADVLCEVAIAAMSAFLVGPLLGSVIAVVAVAVAESVAESILEDAAGGRTAGGLGGDRGSALPPGIRWRELRIDRTALALAGTWDGLLNDPRQFIPRVALRWEYMTNRSTTLPPEDGTFHASCPVGESSFWFQRSSWNTSVTLRADAQDVPLPLAFSPWHLSVAGQTLPLQTGTIDIPGQVAVLDPPDRERAEMRDHIIIGVSGNDAEGWTLEFRGEDAIQRVEVGTTVTDGSGRRWPLRAQLTIAGQTLSFNEEYLNFREQCAEAIIRIAEENKLVVDAPVWDQVMKPEGIIEERVRAAVTGGRPGAGEAIRDLFRDRPDVAERVMQRIIQR